MKWGKEDSPLRRMRRRCCFKTRRRKYDYLYVPRVASSELRSQMLRPGSKVPSPSVSETVGFECVVHDDSDDLSAQEVEVIRSKEQVEAVMSETA